MGSAEKIFIWGMLLISGGLIGCQTLSADQMKTDVFDLGYTAAGPCAVDLEGDGQLSALPGIIGRIQDAMAGTREIAGRLVLDGAAIEAFRSSCPGFSIIQKAGTLLSLMARAISGILPGSGGPSR